MIFRDVGGHLTSERVRGVNVGLSNTFRSSAGDSPQCGGMDSSRC